MKLALRMILAVALGTFLGYKRHHPSYSGAYALIALCSAIYVTIFLALGIPEVDLIHQLINTMLWMAPLTIGVAGWLSAERRLEQSSLMLGIAVTAIAGALAGLGEIVAAVSVTLMTLFFRLILHVVNRNQ